MTALVTRARELFAFDPDVEMSIEVEPRHLTPGELKQLRALGFNRLSLGIQDFDEQVQAGVNRVEPVAHVRRLMDAARAEGAAIRHVEVVPVTLEDVFLQLTGREVREQVTNHVPMASRRGPHGPRASHSRVR